MEESLGKQKLAQLYELLDELIDTGAAMSYLSHGHGLRHAAEFPRARSRRWRRR